ncbi:hypothetical protein U9M48_044402 [Paspalum notatum var. saurae]|uniref:Transcription factor CBF/NF-Y/archaeal histone domain-containing protein n=1 Tax=Paspalum notatum var. saurae TaxID=547442 RepID=A0AAQ3UZK4_PASNO
MCLPVARRAEVHRPRAFDPRDVVRSPFDPWTRSAVDRPSGPVQSSGAVRCGGVVGLCTRSTGAESVGVEEKALARFARPGQARIERFEGKRCFGFGKEAETKASNGNPKSPSKSPIPHDSLFNVPVLPLRSDEPSCAPRGDRTPGRGAYRPRGRFRRWFRRRQAGAMRKKLDTRFPAPRIKKIMQADEDVGKIALAVPVLVSKALELFLQDLCDRTYDITIRKGVKTVGSSHLKQCIQTYNVYDFLREVVSKVPDTVTADVIADDKLGKRRKAEEDGSEEELKRTRNEAESHTSNRRGRGRGRGRGRRGGRVVWREFVTTREFADNQANEPTGLKVEIADEVSYATEAKEATPVSSARASLRSIDLNLDPVDEDDDEVTVPPRPQSSAPATSSAKANLGLTSPATSLAAANLGLTASTSSTTATAGPSVPRSKEGAKLKDFLGSLELPDMNKVEMDPVQFALTSNHTLEEDEDYDNED